jgi:hypothetical protein
VTNLPLPSAVELISVHVPKTAGAIFGNRILPQIYPSYETDILYDYDDLPVNTLIQQGKLTTKTTDFYFVGIQEFFLEDLTHLKSNLDWNQFKIMTINRNRYENYQDKVMNILKNKTLVKNIVEFNSADVEMYQEALSLIVKREGLSNALEMYELSWKISQSQLKKIVES